MLDFHKTRATVITFEPIKTNVNDNNEPISIRSKSTQPLTRAGKRTTAAKRGKTYNLCKARQYMQPLLSAGKRAKAKPRQF